MNAVAIVDTSVLLNVLDIPGFNQDREIVIEEFESHIADGSNILLPMAAVYETGNHISHLSNGRDRRRYAGLFSEQLRMALAGDAPWRAMRMPGREEVGKWIDDFPDYAMRGLGIADLSIVKEWEAAVARHKQLRVFIWSRDARLGAYVHDP